MESLIFRNDDLSPNSNINQIRQISQILLQKYHCEIWQSVSFFAKGTYSGSVYPGAPFKDQPKKFFYDINKFLPNIHHLRNKMLPCKLVSHGLIHTDHSQLSWDAQEMSILTSCNLIETDIFVAPFGKWNEDTKAICEDNNIMLVGQEGWKSLEHNEFDPNHKQWYFHAWRFMTDEFARKINSTEGASARF